MQLDITRYETYAYISKNRNMKQWYLNEKKKIVFFMYDAQQMKATKLICCINLFSQRT